MQKHPGCNKNQTISTVSTPTATPAQGAQSLISEEDDMATQRQKQSSIDENQPVVSPITALTATSQKDAQC